MNSWRDIVLGSETIVERSVAVDVVKECDRNHRQQGMLATGGWEIMVMWAFTTPSPSWDRGMLDGSALIDTGGRLNTNAWTDCHSSKGTLMLPLLDVTDRNGKTWPPDMENGRCSWDCLRGHSMRLRATEHNHNVYTFL